MSNLTANSRNDGFGDADPRARTGRTSVRMYGPFEIPGTQRSVAVRWGKPFFGCSMDRSQPVPTWSA